MAGIGENKSRIQDGRGGCGGGGRICVSEWIRRMYV